MPITVVRQDITKIKADAIVSASGHDLSKHGAVASAIFDAAGPGLSLECAKKGFLDTAEAFVTGAYKLPAKHVIHTVGPEYRDGHSGEALLLSGCYGNCMDAAWEAGCRSIAFPLISSGGYGFPKEAALSTAMAAISENAHCDEMDVTLAVYDRGSYEVSHRLMEDIRDFLETENRSDRVMSCGAGPEEETVRRRHNEERGRRRSSVYEGIAGVSFPCVCRNEDISVPKLSSEKQSRALPKDIKEALTWKDESFSESLDRMIRERGLKPSECYHAANVSKAVFYNIMNKKDYKPTKNTAFAFAVGLKLDLAQTRELLAKAGFAMSRSFPLDLAMEYLIGHQVYNIWEVNEILFDLDLELLGERPV